MASVCRLYGMFLFFTVDLPAADVLIVCFRDFTSFVQRTFLASLKSCVTEQLKSITDIITVLVIPVLLVDFTLLLAVFFK